jgi:hypothetical protein
MIVGNFADGVLVVSRFKVVNRSAVLTVAFRNFRGTPRVALRKHTCLTPIRRTFLRFPLRSRHPHFLLIDRYVPHAWLWNISNTEYPSCSAPRLAHHRTPIPRLHDQCWRYLSNRTAVATPNLACPDILLLSNWKIITVVES